MLASISAAQSLINISIASISSFLLIGFGLRRVFNAKRGRRLGSVAWVWFIPGFVGMAAAVYVALAEQSIRVPDVSIVLILLAVAAGVLIGSLLMVAGWRGKRSAITNIAASAALIFSAGPPARKSAANAARRWMPKKQSSSASDDAGRSWSRRGC